MRVRAFVYANPNTSKTKVRDAIGGNAEAVDRALEELWQAGEIVNDGDKKGNRYRAPVGSGNSGLDRVQTGSAENANSLQDIAGQPHRQPHPVPATNTRSGGETGVGSDRDNGTTEGGL